MCRLFCYHAAMRILTDIGEIGVTYGENTYILRPSLYAMSQIGEPIDIIDYYSCLMSEYGDMYERRRQFDIALLVLHTCCTDDEDVSHIFGFYDESGKFVEGECKKESVLPLARILIKHGVVGSLPPLPKKGNEPDEYMKEFSARDHAALAMAHLGVSEDAAWNMTMTSLVAGLRAKFPQVAADTVSGRAPTQEQTKATMDWFAKIEAKRKKKSGVH